eukprot:GILJ01004073.1.p1 GENE.GILJ01004073.1~~GILJ01004073.1.p1  ORF type:complete len:786 (+),score=133.68 GILJ01004073.1:49-2358(+)
MSDIVMGDTEFKLSESLVGHESDVRGVTELSDGRIATASRDRTVKIWEKKGGKYVVQATLFHHEHFANCVLRRQDAAGCFTGSHDKKAFALDGDGNPVQVYEGHEKPVNSLSLTADGDLVTGSWDGSAKVWNVESGVCKHTLPGHVHAVCVLGLPNGDVLTGSQDKELKLWRNGQLVQKIPNAHGDIIRELAVIPELGVVSCSNDESLKVWTFDLEPLQTLTGHSGYVYSCACIGLDHYVSGGDDMTVKIWQDGTCIQTIEHPGAVWSVAVCSNGDIITGCSDSVTRVFTRDSSRRASDDVLAEYMEICSAVRTKSHSKVGQLELDKLPSVDTIFSTPGKKDGEVKVFRNGPTAEAYQWDASKAQWDKIGDVTDTDDSSASDSVGVHFEGDKFFPGGLYDRMFDVDLGDGLIRRIPWRYGDNALLAAERFLQREEMDRAMYIEQIADFLRVNDRPRTTPMLGMQTSTEPTAPVQRSAPARPSVPVATPSSAKSFPISSFLTFDAGNLDAIFNKISEFNQKLKQEPAREKFSISELELRQLSVLVDVLKDKARYHLSSFNESDEKVLHEKLLAWPSDVIFPALDLLRLYVLHPKSEAQYKGLSRGLDIWTRVQRCLSAPDCSVNSWLLALRYLANMFDLPTNKQAMIHRRSQTLDVLSAAFKMDNKNVRVALATVLLNYATTFDEAPDQDSKLQCLSALAELLSSEKDPEATFRGLVGLGTLIYKDESIRDVAKQLQLVTSLDGLQCLQTSSPETEKVKRVSAEIKQILQ